MVVYDRPASFQLWLVLYFSLSWSDAQLLDYDRPASNSKQDSNSIGQVCIMITARHRQERTVFRWVKPRSKSRVRDSWVNVRYFANPARQTGTVQLTQATFINIAPMEQPSSQSHGRIFFTRLQNHS